MRRALFLLMVSRVFALDLQAPLAEYVVSSGFGYREALTVKGGSTEPFHGGIDLRGPLGSAVLAAADGVVTEVWLPPGWHGGVLYRGHAVFGGMVMIRHDARTYSLYGHLAAVTVREGETVRAGQPIGTQGNTGISTAEHLHFEVRVAPQIPPSPPWRDATDRIMERIMRRYQMEALR